MLPNIEYQKQPKPFWAQVKLISMTLGYSKNDSIKEFSIEEIVGCLKANSLNTEHLLDGKGIYSSEIIRTKIDPGEYKEHKITGKEDIKIAPGFKKVDLNYQSTISI